MRVLAEALHVSFMLMNAEDKNCLNKFNLLFTYVVYYSLTRGAFEEQSQRSTWHISRTVSAVVNMWNDTIISSPDATKKQ